MVKSKLYWLMLTLLSTPSLIRADANCDKNVVIESTEVYNYLGNVSFTVPTGHDGYWKLDLQTVVPFTFIGGWGIKIETGPSPLTHATITSLEPIQLVAGDLITFRFRLYWDRHSPTTPIVIGLNWEGHVICSSRKANEISDNDYYPNH